MSDIDVEDSTILLTRKAVTGDAGVVVVRTGAGPLAAVSPGHYVLLVSIVALIGGIVLGYDLKLSQGLLGPITLEIALSLVQQHAVLLVWFLGAVLSSLFGGIVLDGCGRRWSILFSSSLLVVASVLTATSYSFWQLMAARLIAGISSPLLSVAWSVYAAEMSGTLSRGRTVLCHRLGIALGLLASSIAVAQPEASWRIIASLGIVPTILQAGLLLRYLPPSPHFVLVQASQAKRRLICCSLGPLLEVLVLGCALVLALPFTGRVTLDYYLSHLSYVFGGCSTHKAMITVILVFVQFVATCLVICIIDKIGRRLILLIGSTLMFLCLFTLCICHHFGELPKFEATHCQEGGLQQALQSVQYFDGFPSSATPMSSIDTLPYPLLPTPLSLVASESGESNGQIPPGYHYLAIVVILGFHFSFWASLGAISWILLTEIFPAANRGRCFSLVTIHYWAAEMLLSPTLNLAINGMDLGKMIIFYCITCFLTIIFIFLFVPETKGKSLHQIAQELKNTSPKTRMFQFLLELPCLKKNEYLNRRSKQYRPVNYSAVENTII